MSFKGLVFASVSVIGVTSFLWCCNEPEPPQILLVGVYHYFPDDQQCNWKGTYENLLRFNPDQIAIEYDIPGDTLSFQHYAGSHYAKTWDSLMVQWVGARINPADSVLHYERLVKTDSSLNTRINLWKFHHLNADIGNRDFQAYQIYKRLQTRDEAIDTTSFWAKDFKRRLMSTVSNRKNGEFFNLVFPLAKKLGIPYLYPTDYKGTFPDQSKAYEALATSLDKTIEWENYMAFWKSFSDELDSKAAECRALEFTNTEQWIAKSDSAQARILDHLKSEQFEAYKQVWYQRNQEIANRIDGVVKAAGAKKTVAFYGNMHIYPLRKFLTEKGYRVKLLEEIH